MRLIKSLLRSTFSIILLLVAVPAFTQHAPDEKTVVSPNNQLEILMIIVALLLAFVIWGLGQVLVAMGKQALEKGRQGNKIFSAVLLIGLLCLSHGSNAQSSNTAETVNIVPNYGGMSSTSFWIMVAVLLTELIVIAFMMMAIRRIQAELLPRTEKVKIRALREWWSGLDKKIFTKAVAVEKEQDVMLDHDYDGIKELDNALPPWWKYGFIITVVVAFVYLLDFHVFGYGKNPTEEYAQELAEAKIAKELYDSKNADKVDEANLQMPTAEGLTAGKEIFTTACWACHGKLGEGSAGPNLTDDYWLHKGSLSDIYQSIKHGYPDKGMQSWEKNYSPKQINELAGYIRTLKGTNPLNAKEPQGDLYEEQLVIDSTASKTVMDSVNTKKNSAGILRK